MTLFHQNGLRSTEKINWKEAMHEAMHKFFRTADWKVPKPNPCVFLPILDTSGSMSREEYNEAVDVAITSAILDMLQSDEPDLP